MAALAPTPREATQTLIDQSRERALEPWKNPPKYEFKFDEFLKREHRVGLGPDIPACEADRQGHCPLGNNCPKKHDNKSSFNRLICKHWMRGLCKKGATCDFKHELNLRDEKECPEYARWQQCSNGEDCLYQHIDPLYKRPSCPWYDRGFCPLGPHCALRHVKREKLCPYYLAGFCPDGKECKHGAHAKWRDDKDMKKPEVYKPKTEEELQKEAEERERQLREEEEREIQREEQRERNFTGERRGGSREWRGRRRRGRGRSPEPSGSRGKLTESEHEERQVERRNRSGTNELRTGCYRCEQAGHDARDCPTGPFCTRCSSFKHVKKDCPYSACDARRIRQREYQKHRKTRE